MTDFYPERQRAGSGFTLIEMMIVIAVVAICAAVALPSYGDYLRRGQLPEAFTFLSDYRVKMEQYYQDNRNYGTLTQCAADPAASSWNAFTSTGSKYFSYACETTMAAQGFTVTATGAAGRAVGHVYTINQNGDRATIKFKAQTTAQPCWLTTGTTC